MTQSDYQVGAIEVAPGVYAFIQPGGATDAGFIVEEEGVVIIDTLMTTTLAERLLAEVRHVTDKPVRYVVNTHWHGDHLFGNALMPPAPIVAHDTCRDDLFTEWEAHREFLRDLYPAVYEEWRDLPRTPPNVTFSDSLTLHLGARPIELRFYGRAHTRGDVAVFMPTEGVLFAGDLSFHKYIPNARDGFPPMRGCASLSASSRSIAASSCRGTDRSERQRTSRRCVSALTSSCGRGGGASRRACPRARRGMR